MNQDMPAVPSAGDAPIEPRVLRSGLERFLLAMHSIHRGYYNLDLLTGEVYLSPRWKEQLGYGDAEPHPDLGGTPPSRGPGSRGAHPQALIAGDLSQFQIDYRLRHKNGSYRLLRSCGASQSASRAGISTGARTNARPSASSSRCTSPICTPM